jgi:DNA polymerase
MTETKVFIDFETRSPVNILTAGMFPYLNDLQAGVLCMSYTVQRGETLEPTRRYNPTRQERKTRKYTPPQDFIDLINEGASFVAHNVLFEVEAMRTFFNIEIPFNKIECTMDMCRYHNLPGSLEKSLQALNADVVKDLENKKTLELFSKPKAIGLNGHAIWNEPEDYPVDFENLNVYCDRDTICSVELYKRLPQLPPFERAVQIHTWLTNMNGVNFDRAPSKNVLELMDVYIDTMSQELSRLTEGVVSKPTQTVALKNYIIKRFNVPVKGVDKASVAALLSKPGLDPELRKILDVRQACSSSAIAKLKVVLSQGEIKPHGILNVRGALNYSGAITNRFSSYGVQIHNFPRPSKDYTYNDAINFVEVLKDDPHMVEVLFEDLALAASSSLRAFIRPKTPDHVLIQCDLSNIEARGLAYLAKQEDLLDAFRSGADTYKLTYSKLSGVPVDRVTKAQRDIGKVVQLSLGYGGGVDALLGMAQGYGVDVREFVYNVFFESRSTQEIARSEYTDLILKSRWYRTDSENYYADKNRTKIQVYLKSGVHDRIKQDNFLYTTFTDDLINSFITQWRQTHPAISGMWRECEDTAKAVLRDGKPRAWASKSGKELFRFARGGNDTLYVVFPTGTRLTYRGCRIEKERITYLSPGTGAALFVRKKMTTGGLLVENITQAWARNVFCHYLIQIKLKLGLIPDFHVHDEGVFSVLKSEAEATAHKIEAIMSEPPAWASEAPIGSEATIRERFWK